MNTKNVSILRSLAFCLATVVLMFASTLPASGQSEKSDSSNGLAGTWRVQVTLQNCTTHTPLAPPFSSLLSFHSGGTMSGTTSNPGFAAGQRTSDYGVWSFTGDHSYSAASEAYILFPAGPFVRGTQRIVQAISVDGDEFTSDATVQFFDVNHVQVLAACAFAAGQRFD